MTLLDRWLQMRWTARLGEANDHLGRCLPWEVPALVAVALAVVAVALAVGVAEVMEATQACRTQIQKP
jgi:hypothetical protein